MVVSVLIVIIYTPINLFFITIIIRIVINQKIFQFQIFLCLSCNHTTIYFYLELIIVLLSGVYSKIREP
jgi:hypothetical protein